MPISPPVTIPTLAGPPPMTGNLLVDAGGWAGALQLNLSTNSYALVCRATDPADGKDYVYLGVSCNDFVPAPTTRLVLGLVTKTGAPPTCGWKVHFNPIPPGPGGAISTDLFWRDLGAWNVPGGNTLQPPNAGWPLPSSLSWVQGGGSNLWTFETKIYVNPTTNNYGVWFPPPATPFYAYLNLLNNSNAGAPGNVQVPWPGGCTMIGDISTHTPDYTTWGQAQF